MKLLILAATAMMMPFAASAQDSIKEPAVFIKQYRKGGTVKSYVTHKHIVDYAGNEINEVFDVWPRESRHKAGYQFFNEEGQITLEKYEEVTKGYFRWRCKLKRYNYGTCPDIIVTGYVTEFEVNESTGVWVHDPITGKTYEYVIKPNPETGDR